MSVNSLLSFILLAALVLDGGMARPVHPPVDAPMAIVPRASTNSSTTSPLPIKAISHGAAPALAALPIHPRQDEEDVDQDEEAESKRPSHRHRKPKPSKGDDTKPPSFDPTHLVPRANEHSNGTLPVHVPRSNNATSPVHLPRSSNSTTSALPVHVPRGQNSTSSPINLPRSSSSADNNSNSNNTTMPVHIEQKNGTMHLHAPRAQSSSSGGTNSTKPAPISIIEAAVPPPAHRPRSRSSKNTPADVILNGAPLHPRATVETHVPAEKVTGFLPGHHHRRREEPEQDEDAPAREDDETHKPAVMPVVVPRHSTGVAPADMVLHSGSS